MAVAKMYQQVQKPKQLACTINEPQKSNCIWTLIARHLYCVKQVFFDISGIVQRISLLRSQCFNKSLDQYIPFIELLSVCYGGYSIYTLFNRKYHVQQPVYIIIYKQLLMYWSYTNL